MWQKIIHFWISIITIYFMYSSKFFFKFWFCCDCVVECHCYGEFPNGFYFEKKIIYHFTVWPKIKNSVKNNVCTARLKSTFGIFFRHPCGLASFFKKTFIFAFYMQTMATSLNCTFFRILSPMQVLLFQLMIPFTIIYRQPQAAVFKHTVMTPAFQ